MPAPEVHTRLLHPLNTTGIPYMVTGGLAAIIYGEPRLTNDVDVVLDLRPDDAARLMAAFPAAEYYVPPAEAIREEAARAAHGHFNLLHLATTLRADVYPLGNDPLGAWGMERRRRIPIAADPIWVAPIEYVMLSKLRYYREGGSDRHLRDIAAMLRISGSLVDRSAMNSWLDRLGLKDQWERARTMDAG